MANKYDEQIARLLKVWEERGEAAFRGRMSREWGEAVGLFQFCNSSGEASELNEGCLTMIHGYTYLAATPELTAAIKADTRLVDCIDDVQPEHFPAMAEWQRRLDVEIRGGGVDEQESKEVGSNG